jgi:hypothetical protein
MTTADKIFISHASADRSLADLLRDTLVLGGVPRERIFYSSSRATGIPSGTDVHAHLRSELRQAGLVIELISTTFLTRPMCLMELGGAWALEKSTYPIVVPPLTRREAAAQIGDVHMGLLSSDEEINDVFDELQDRLRAELGLSTTATQWNPVARRFMEGLPAVRAVTVKVALPSSAPTAPPPSVTPPAPLQPRYEQREPYLHRPVGEHMTQHRIGIHNPKENQMVTGVRLQWIEMSPRPRVDLGYPPSIPSAVPMLNGGDATIGISLPLGQQELWMIISTGTGSDGIMSAGVFAPGYRPWHGTPWQFEPDDRWRFTYRIVADNLPNATFSVVMTAVDGHIRCDLEG